MAVKKPSLLPLPITRRVRRYSTPLDMVEDHQSSKLSVHTVAHYFNLLFSLIEVCDKPSAIAVTEFRIAARDYGAICVVKGFKNKTAVIAFVKGASHRDAFLNLASLVRVGQVQWKADKWATK